MSKRSEVRAVFNTVNEVALPGDMVFCIKEHLAAAPRWFGAKKVFRRYEGYHGLDHTTWHTGLYSAAKKERGGATVRPFILHTGKTDVREDHIPPAYFANDAPRPGTVDSTVRIEIGRFQGISDEQRCAIMEHGRSMMGMPFGEDGMIFTFWTYLFGLPALFSTNRKISCQAFVCMAYSSAGIDFPNHLEDAPIFNLAKRRGYPLGHPPDRVNLRFPYLEDHHLYRDDRITIVLAAYQDMESKAFVTERSPGKYSWNPALRQVYKADAGPVCHTSVNRDCTAA
jgi:hypothetical protein